MLAKYIIYNNLRLIICKKFLQVKSEHNLRLEQTKVTNAQEKKEKWMLSAFQCREHRQDIENKIEKILSHIFSFEESPFCLNALSSPAGLETYLCFPQLWPKEDPSGSPCASGIPCAWISYDRIHCALTCLLSLTAKSCIHRQVLVMKIIALNF